MSLPNPSLSQAIEYLLAQSNTPNIPGTDWSVGDPGTGPVISYWNAAKLGTQPAPSATSGVTATQYQTWALSAAVGVGMSRATGIVGGTTALGGTSPQIDPNLALTLQALRTICVNIGYTDGWLWNLLSPMGAATPLPTVPSWISNSQSHFRTTKTTSDATGVVNWTFPVAFTAPPVVTATVQTGLTGRHTSAQVISLSNTAVSIKAYQTQPLPNVIGSLLALVGFDVSVLVPQNTTIHITAGPGTG